MMRLLALLLVLPALLLAPARAQAASSFSANICLEEVVTGEQNNTWGTTLNSNFAVLDAYTAGILTLSVAGSSNVVLSFNCSTVADQSRNAHFIFTGALTGNINVLFPAGRSRVFSVFNNTSGAFSLTVCANNGASACAGTSQSVAQGQTHGYVSDGTNVTVRESAATAAVQIGGDLGGTNASPTVIGTHLGSALPVNQGGTGATAAGATAAGNIGALAAASSLSDIASAASGRSNLGLGGIATQGDPLTVAHGGTGNASFAAHQALVATGATTVAGKTITDCLDSGGSHLNYAQSTDSFSCGTTSSGGNSFTTEASVASSGTTDLGALSSHVVTVTGTSAISSFGSSANTNNPIFFVRFQGALTLTYNATSMILPGATSIPIHAGDNLIAKYEGSGHWRVTLYWPGGETPYFGSTVDCGANSLVSLTFDAYGRVRGSTCSGGGGGGGGG